LTVEYQPKIDVEKQDIVGVEALLRWHHDKLGAIHPGSFVPLAEELGLIHDVGIWLIKEVSQEINAWKKLSVEDIKVAINLSAEQIKHPSLLSDIHDVLNETEVNPHQIEFEITENILIDQSFHVMENLKGIRKLGINIALDDFGTGFSSLSYLTRFPFSTLKIDKCFVNDCLVNEQSAAIIKIIIQLCKQLKLDIVAEGVETKAELEFIRDNGCNVIQGYIFSTALKKDRLLKFIQDKPWLNILKALNHNKSEAS
jgi:EAL domain-containing protein (putative c-di-GMP-specific phosphodiesterase class I)